MKFLLSLLLFSSLCYGQTAQLTGKVLDEEGLPMPGANVTLSAPSGEIVIGDVSSSNGQFKIEVAPGSYTLIVSFIAYSDYSTPVVLTSDEVKDLGDIQLLLSSMGLEEVVVERRSTMMEFKQDKRIFNVAADLTAIGSNASDILNNVPSVSVDIEGNVSLRGSQNVRILVDGKPSALIGSDPAAALRQLPANLIERIEVITNPSARYEAEGEAGIINIVLKKDDRTGFNGNVEVSGGYPENFGVSAGLNYRSGKINWFSNASFNYRRSPGGGYTEQNYNGADTTSRSYIDRDQIRGGYGGTFRFGADYTIAPNQTLTGSVLLQASRGNNTSTLTYEDFNANDFLVSITDRIDNETEDDLTYEADLHWEKIFESKEHKWTADFSIQDNNDLEYSDITQDTSFLNSMPLEGANIVQRVQNQEDEQNIILQTDYVRPLGEKRNFEIGARAGLRTIVNNYSVEQRAPGEEFVSLPSFTNDFRYEERIYAAYGIYNDVITEDITYQIGLRTELTNIATIEGSNAPNNRDYLDFFPSAFLTYKVNARNNLQLNYSRRISRPYFRLLLPFSNYTDPRNFRRGNPDLDPEYTDSYEAGIVHYWEKASLYSGIYYRHRTGVIERIRRIDSVVSGVSYTSLIPINLAVQDAYGFEFNLNYDVTKWYSLNANVNIFGSVTTGSFEGVNYGNRNFTSTGRLTNRLKIKNSDLQVSYNFQGPRTTTQGNDLSINSLDIGWSKEILKGNGTLNFSVRDLFNSRRRRSFTAGPDWEAYSEYQWRERQWLVTFSYRINQKQSGKPGGGRDYGSGQN